MGGASVLHHQTTIRLAEPSVATTQANGRSQRRSKLAEWPGDTTQVGVVAFIQLLLMAIEKKKKKQLSRVGQQGGGGGGGG